MEHIGEGARVSEGLFLEAQLMVLNMLSSTKPDCNPQGIWNLGLNMIPSKNPQRGCSHPLSSGFRGPLLRGGLVGRACRDMFMPCRGRERMDDLQNCGIRGG